jgi:hypothetical protein
VHLESQLTEPGVIRSQAVKIIAAGTSTQDGSGLDTETQKVHIALDEVQAQCSLRTCSAFIRFSISVTAAMLLSLRPTSSSKVSAFKTVAMSFDGESSFVVDGSAELLSETSFFCIQNTKRV